MRPNALSPSPGSRRPAKRPGRGTGSGLGKTAGRGHKGQKSREGGGPKAGFEGGQMPLQRRLPKSGFRSRTAGLTAEVRLSELSKVSAEVIDLAALKAADVVSRRAQRAKVIQSGTIDRAVVLKGIAVTKGARTAIEAVGGKIEG